MNLFHKTKFTSILTTTIVTIALVLPLHQIPAKASENSRTFKVLSLNVAGLPAILSSSKPSSNTSLMSPLLNNYDVVSVQEDFAYHNDLISKVTLPYLTPTSGNVPLGDGMNFMSRFPLYETTRYKWKDSHGIISDGADQMTPKGILYSSMEIEPGYFVDIYDIHADADTDEASLEARRSNMEQLASLINERSTGKAVIVIGDTNSRYTRAGDNFEDAVVKKCGLTDAWIQLVRNGDVPKDGDAIMDSNNPNSANNEVVDKIFYRSGKNVNLIAKSYSLLDKEFTDSNGKQLSDHYPITTTFEYSLNKETQMTETFGGAGGTGFSFIEKMNNTFPNKVAIRSGSRLDSIAFTYNNVVAQVGGTGGSYKELVLGKNEYITSMELSKAKKDLLGTNRISYIKLTTNLGHTLEGGTKGDTITFKAPNGYSIAGLYGFADDEIDRLGAIYKSI
ncbi:endonuclease/exonuclease/phosphatase family protein [Clostridium sp. SHJSY1]|uniref:jacalin-like lectin n=1 Tax=Clostridium sp. SHJSY1 TaxID=2942483 RepID=UPI002875B9ED|nr:jacalin-like lectin [Clostridium sp. SHJSY1]MDS0527805.1 endonuclease/exonuclease/phosphatase family protein [Clostridium sp. SHJSY1]